MSLPIKKREKLTAAKLQDKHNRFWAIRSGQFATGVRKRPADVAAAVRAFESEVRIKGLGLARSLESLMLEMAPASEKLASAGGTGKRMSYEKARDFVLQLHRTWSECPDEYKDIGDFAEDASQRIHLSFQVAVTSATVRQWLKEMHLPRPRYSA